MDSIKKLKVPLVWSLALHISLLGAFAISFEPESVVVKAKPVPDIIQATILDEKTVVEESERLKTNEKNKKLAQQKKQHDLALKLKREEQRLQQLKQQRKTEEKKAKQRAEEQKKIAEKESRQLAEQKKQKALKAASLAKLKEKKLAEEKKAKDRAKKQKQEAEKKRLAAKKKAGAEKKAAEQRKKEADLKRKADAKRKAEEKQKQEAEAKRLAEEASRRAEAEQQAEAARQADAARLKTVRDQRATVAAGHAIQQKVNRNWTRPIAIGKGLQSTIRVKLLPSGDVMEAVVIRSSGDAIFDRSAENAVRKASPLPVPSDPDLFMNKFRTFTFVFKPQ